jgi:hypothetical protein
MAKLTSRDLDILHHVARYRLTTRDVLQREFFSEASPSAVGKVAARLISGGWLRERRLASQWSYFVLGQAAISLLGVPKNARRPFTEQSFPLAYGYLVFCIERGLRRLTADEFQRQFPELCRRRSAAGGYYLDARSAPCRLGTVILDRGNPPKNLLRKIDRTIRQRYSIPGFVPLIQNGWFSITILTAWPVKQKYLESAIRIAHKSTVPVDVVTASALQQFFRRI